MPDPDYFTLAEFRTLPDMDDTTRYPDAAVLAAASYVTSVIERVCGTSFVSRTVTDEVYDGGSDAIVLTAPYVLSVTSATEDGVAVTDDLRVRHGILRKFDSATSFVPNTWSAGVGNVEVTYAAGYSATCPGDLKSAAMQATRNRLLETETTANVSDRRTSVTNEMGTTQFVIAGEDRPTGYPVVDAVIMGWARRLNLHGFA